MIHQFAIRPSGGGTGGATASLLISAGASSDLRTDVTFANSNGVSFGLDAAGVVTASVQTNYLTTAMASNRGSDFVQATAAFHGTNASGTIASNAISVSVAAAANNSINISAGTTSSNVTAVTFSNGSGVSFGFDGSNVTATVATNYQSQGAYLTTAMASNRGSDFVQATAAFAGTNASGTINSTGISVSVAAQSVNSVKFSAGTLTSNRTDITFSNSNGVSFGLETNGVITATVATNYQSQGAYLTTAALSQDSSKYAGTAFATTTSAGTAVAGTLNTSGLTLGVPPFLTTAMQSNAATISNILVSAGTVTTNGSAFTFSNSNNFSFGLGTGTAAGIITASYTVPTVTNSAWTLSDAATSITVARLAFTNSNGLTLSLSTATGGSATVIGSYTVPTVTNSSWTVSDSATSATVGRLMFSNANGVSFGLITSNNGSQSVTGSIATTYAGTGFTTATTAGTVIVGTLNTSGLSMGVPAYLTTAEQSRSPLSYYANIPFYPNVSLPTTTADSNTFQVFPLSIQEKLSIGYLRFIAFGTFTSTTLATSAVNNATGFSTAFSETLQWNAVLYTVGSGASSRSLQYVYSTSAGMTYAVSVSQASTSNASQATVSQAFTFPREGFTTNSTSTNYATTATTTPILTTQFNLQGNVYLDIPFATSLSAGNYWMAVNRMTGTVGGKNMDVNYKFYGVNQSNVSFNALNQATNVSNCAFQLGLGSWTTNVAQTTSSIAFASISASTSYFLPYVQFINQA